MRIDGHNKIYLSRSQTRSMSAYEPIGDAHGGAAYGERNDPVTAAVVVGGQLIAADMQSNAAGDAAQTQTNAANAANALQKQQFDIINQQQAAGRGAGYQALNTIRSMLPGEYTAYTESGAPVTRQVFDQAGYDAAMAKWNADKAAYDAGKANQTTALKTMSGPFSSIFNRAFQLGADTAAGTNDGSNLNPFSGGGHYEIRPNPSDWSGETTIRVWVPDTGSQYASQSLAPQPTREQFTSNVPVTQTGSGYLTHQFNAQDFANNIDPGYAWRLQQGQMANQRQANVGGGALSGNTLAGLQDYTQGQASQEYGNAFNRYQTQRANIYNTLSNIAGLGQTAQQQANQASTNYATNAANLMTGAAAAQAAGITGQANAYAGALQNAGNTYMLSNLLGNKNTGVNYSVSPTSGGMPTGSNLDYMGGGQGLQLRT